MRRLDLQLAIRGRNGPDGEDGMSLVRCQIDRSTEMVDHSLVTERQPPPCPLADIPGRKERFENALFDMFWNTSAIILDLDGDHTVIPLDADLDQPSQLVNRENAGVDDVYR